eukprot:TRINITY_DN3938_c0_g2_i1.p1 TRINITY_DN3938_c0_g2~~TRINITY_DN3938_c0_g2_i1.p1  ORF type:complete len:689 (+),score=187.15 TRINITY_DN3938_c0_g2_i1:41-2107(+)
MFGRVGNLIRSVGTPKRRKNDKKAEGEGSPKDGMKMGLGFEVMEGAMQKKLQNGVKYNMKIVIRGERRSGKSSLLRRLQGKYHDEGYNQTPQISAATVHWCSEFTQDPVKVEVWDVVDSGFITQEIEDHHKSLNAPPGIEVQVSDASNVNVYRDAHCAIFVIDATRSDALEYLKTQLPNVPRGVSVVVLRNKCDLTDDVVITEKDILKVLEKQQPATTSLLTEVGGNKVPAKYGIPPHCISASMVNCYGIKNLYSYLNIPFQQLRCEMVEETLRNLWSSSLDHFKQVKESERPYSEYEIWLIEQSQKNQESKQPSPTEDDSKPPLAPAATKKEDLVIGNPDGGPQQRGTPKNNLSFKHQGSFNLNAIDEGFFDDVSDDEVNGQQQTGRSSADSEDLIAAVAMQRDTHKLDATATTSSASDHLPEQQTKSLPESDGEEEEEEVQIDFTPILKKETKTRSKIEEDEREKRVRITNMKTQASTELRNEAIKKDKAAAAEKEEEFARQIDVGGIDESFFDDDNSDDNDGKGSNVPNPVEETESPEDQCLEDVKPKTAEPEKEEEEELDEDDAMNQQTGSYEFKPKPEQPSPRSTAVSAEALEAVQRLMQNMQQEHQDTPPAEDSSSHRRRRKESKEANDDKKEKRRRRRKEGDEEDSPKERKEKKDKKDKRRRRREEADKEEGAVVQEERSQ